MPFAKRILFFLLPVVMAGTSVYGQFAQTDSVLVIGSLNLFGNEKTKSYIIYREISFTAGDTLTYAKFQLLRAKALRQVFDLGLFTSVDMEILPPDSAGLTNINIYLKERWYFFAFPILEIADRNFNQWWLERKLSRLNYGVSLVKFNVRGRNETMRLNVQGGFTRKFSVDYNFPYINKALTIGSALNFTYSDNREVWYTTQKNKLLFFRDNDKIIYRRLKASVAFTYRKQIYTTQTLEAEYNNLQIADTVAKPGVNPDFFLNGSTRQQSIYVSYRYEFEMLDYRVYPLNGRYLSAEAGQYTFINPSPPLQIAYINASWHKQIKGRHYCNLIGSTKLSLPAKQPYNLYKALGYGYFVRGFEYYVIDGQHFALGKANYLYNILKQRNIHLPWRGLKKFRNIPLAVFLKTYYDAGYAYSKTEGSGNTFDNTYLAGFGAGIDVVTYYDRVLKFEYSFNNKGQRGLFLHFSMLF